MKQLFLQHLPTNAQLILASTQDDLDTESLAKLPDKILQVPPTHSIPPILSTVAPQSVPQPSEPSPELRELPDVVSQLTTTINHFSINFTPHRHGPTPRRQSQLNKCRSPLPHHDSNNDHTTKEQMPRTTIPDLAPPQRSVHHAVLSPHNHQRQTTKPGNRRGRIVWHF